MIVESPCKTNNLFEQRPLCISEYFPVSHRLYVGLGPSSFASHGYYYASPVVVCLRLCSHRHLDHRIGAGFAPSKSHMPPRRYVPLPLLPPPRQQTLFLQPHLLEPRRELRATPHWPGARSHEPRPLSCQSVNPGSERGICRVAQRNETSGATPQKSRQKLVIDSRRDIQ